MVTYIPGMADAFRALSDPSRRRILRLLAAGELPLHRIEAHFRFSRPAVIKHIRVLQASGLVLVRKEGRRTLHRLRSRPLRRVRDWVAHFEAFWDDRLLRLKQQVEHDS